MLTQLSRCLSIELVTDSNGLTSVRRTPELEAFRFMLSTVRWTRGENGDEMYGTITTGFEVAVVTRASYEVLSL